MAILEKDFASPSLTGHCAFLRRHSKSKLHRLRVIALTPLKACELRHRALKRASLLGSLNHLVNALLVALLVVQVAFLAAIQGGLAGQHSWVTVNVLDVPALQKLSRAVPVNDNIAIRD